jgi:hypothetical protein
MAAIAFNLKKYLKKGGKKLFQDFLKALVDILQGDLLAFSPTPVY